MNADDVLAVHRLHPLSFFLQQTCLSDVVQNRLVEATYNRATLLTELTDVALSQHLNLSADDVRQVHLVCQLIRVTCANDAAVRGRHLPVVFGRDPCKSIHENALMLRPKSWTWLELLASGVQLSAQQLAASLNVVFEKEDRPMGPPYYVLKSIKR